MQLTGHEDNGVRILELGGRFDAHEAPTVTSWLTGDLTQPRVVVDLSGVTFIDSTALATLVQGMKRCREHQGDLVLANPQRAVRIIFELTRLDKAFSIFSGRDDAVHSFAATSAAPASA